MIINKFTVFGFVFGIVIWFSQISYAQGVGCAAGYSCAEMGLDQNGSECSNAEWTAALVGRESSGNYAAEYSAVGALGRYQFVNDTRSTIGQRANLPCSGSGDREGFRSCPGLQDAYFLALVEGNKVSISNACSQYCGQIRDGVEVTESGLLAIAHNVGPGCANQWAQGGRAAMTHIVAPGKPPCTDAAGTDVVQEYGAEMGGFDVGSGTNSGTCGQGLAIAQPAPYQGHLIGCDPTIFDAANDRIEALKELEIEAAKALITQPAPVEQTTCLEQHTEVIKAVMQNVHSNVEKADNSIAVLVQQPLQKSMKQFLGFSDGDADSVSVNIAGSMSDVMNKQFNKITEGFGDALQSLDQITGGLTAPPTNCDLNEQAWLISQCVQMPSLPSLSNVIGGKLDELSGTIAEAPERLIQKVCSAANSQMDGIFGGVQDKLDNVTNSITRPLSDVTGQVNSVTDL